jgi:hypothetical protein
MHNRKKTVYKKIGNRRIHEIQNELSNKEKKKKRIIKNKIQVIRK